MFFLSIGLIFLVWILYYNRFIVLFTRVKSAWADIDVQLKRRHELVPNLLEIVKAYAMHEKNIFEAVAVARTHSLQAQGSQKSQAESVLADSLKSLMVVIENYPDLKADNTFLQLHVQLVEIEESLQYARRYYNGSVRDFNSAIESFPGNIVARIFGFKAKEFFQLDDVSQAAVPKADLG